MAAAANQVPTGQTGVKAMAVNADQVQHRSYLIWEKEGCPEGRDWEFWFMAEAELAQEEAVDEGKAIEFPKSSARKVAAVEAA
jgi:hypothetical protein